MSRDRIDARLLRAITCIDARLLRAITCTVAIVLAIVLGIAAQRVPLYVTRWNFDDHMDRVLHQRCNAGVTAACDLADPPRTNR